jgi:hypothetical protein
MGFSYDRIPNNDEQLRLAKEKEAAMVEFRREIELAKISDDHKELLVGVDTLELTQEDCAIWYMIKHYYITRLLPEEIRKYIDGVKRSSPPGGARALFAEFIKVKAEEVIKKDGDNYVPG